MAGRGIVANRLTDGTQLLHFDETVYRLNAIKKAAYKFGGHFHILIGQHDRIIEVRLSPKESRDSLDTMAGEFCNEVLDQELREIIAEETVGIRDLLLAQAFSKTSLIDPELETCDYDSTHNSETPGNQ